MVSKRLSLNQAKLIKKHRYILQKLSTSSDKDRKTILKNSPNDLFKALNLVFKLLANDKIELNENQIKKIKKHKPMIKSTSQLRSNNIKGKLTRQRGGALPAILATVLPILGGSGADPCSTLGGIIPHFYRFFGILKFWGGYSGFVDFSSFNDF